MKRSHLPLPGKLLLTLLMLAAISAVGYMAWPVLAYRYRPLFLEDFIALTQFRMHLSRFKFVLIEGPVVGVAKTNRFTDKPTGDCCFWYLGGGFKAMEAQLYPDQVVTSFWSNDGSLFGVVSEPRGDRRQSPPVFTGTELKEDSPFWPGPQTEPSAPWLSGDATLLDWAESQREVKATPAPKK